MSPSNRRAITIRPYVATDVSTLATLFRSSVRGIASRDYTASQIRAWAPDHIAIAPQTVTIGGVSMMNYRMEKCFESPVSASRSR